MLGQELQSGQPPPLLGPLMRIENEIKLDFKDVLIRPKRSTLNSRNQVDVNRTFRFLHLSLIHI